MTAELEIVEDDTMHGMKWFRVYSEIKDDPKMLELDDAQFRVWWNLMAMASAAEERGVIPAYRPKGLAAALHTDEKTLETALALFVELGMVDFCGDRSICLKNFVNRQYDKPSDHPEEAKKRKEAMKERQKNAGGTPKERQKNATERDSEEEQDSEGDSLGLLENSPHTPQGAVNDFFDHSKDVLSDDELNALNDADAVAAAPEKPKVTRAPKQSVSYVEDFKLFYARYPRKMSPGTAEKAYIAARKRGCTHEQIMTNLEIACKDFNYDEKGRFIPYPASWLNAKNCDAAEAVPALTFTTEPTKVQSPGLAAYERIPLTPEQRAAIDADVRRQQKELADRAALLPMPDWLKNRRGVTGGAAS